MGIVLAESNLSALDWTNAALGIGVAAAVVSVVLAVVHHLIGRLRHAGR